MSCLRLQFRRGLESDLPASSDAAIGEPLFTVDSGKLFIKRNNGSYVEINGGTGGGTGGATRLRDLTDVAITTDANGEPIIADGAVLRWTEYETGGVWTSSDTLDGGGYT